MAKFLMEKKISAKAIAHVVKHTPDKSELLQRLCNTLGITLLEYYISVTDNKAMLFFESPDIDRVATLGMYFLSVGGAEDYEEVRYIPLVTVPEANELFKKAGKLPKE